MSGFYWKRSSLEYVCGQYVYVIDKYENIDMKTIGFPENWDELLRG